MPFQGGLIAPALLEPARGQSETRIPTTGSIAITGGDAVTLDVGSPAVVSMSNYQFVHDNGGFSDAICWWDFNSSGEFEWREGNSGGFTTVPNEWYVGHPIAFGADYELGLKSSTVVAGTGVTPTYFTGNPMNVGDWRTFNATALHSVSKTSLFGLGTYIVDTVYQIRLIAEPGNILDEFTITATCIRS